MIPKPGISGKRIPQYKRIIQKVHSTGKPFLLHSCGAIQGIMDDMISLGIDAKHSIKDNINPFPTWCEDYGRRIANFGGVDMNILCTESFLAMVRAFKES